MDVREKLVGLVHNARMNALWHNAQKPDEYITDMLMEDGVTVQKQGSWIKYNFLGHEQWACSECQTLGSPQWKCCPVCETRMPQPPKGE